MQRLPVFAFAYLRKKLLWKILDHCPGRRALCLAALSFSALASRYAGGVGKVGATRSGGFALMAASGCVGPHGAMIFSDSSSERLTPRLASAKSLSVSPC